MYTAALHNINRRSECLVYYYILLLPEVTTGIEDATVMYLSLLMAGGTTQFPAPIRDLYFWYV